MSLWTAFVRREDYAAKPVEPRPKPWVLLDRPPQRGRDCPACVCVRARHDGYGCACGCALSIALVTPRRYAP